MNFIKICALADKFEKQAAARKKKKKKKKGKKWKKMPKGWDAGSRKSYHGSLVGKTQHPVSKCMKKMKGNVGNTGAFCASLQDREDPGWRKKKRKKKK